MAESSITQKTSESKFLDPVLFPPNRGFEYKVGTKLDAQDELKKWYAAKITEVIEAEGLLLIHFEYWSQRFDELIPANSSRLRPSTVHDKKPPETFNIGDYVHSKWGGISYPAKIIEFYEPDHYKVLFYDGFVKVVRPALMKKMTASEIKELDLENFGKLTLMPSYPNPLFDPEINKKVTGKRRSAIRKPEDSVQNDHSAESTTTTMTTTPELKPSLEIHEVSKTSLKPLPRRSHTNRPDLVDFAKRRGPVQDPLNMEITDESMASTSNETDQTPNIRLTRSIINAANKIFSKDEIETDERMIIQRAHVEDSVETIFTKVIPDRKRNHESPSSTPESVSKKTKRENIQSNVFESTSPVVCAKPTAVDATPVVADSVPLPATVVEPTKPTEDRKALRKAAMGVAFAVAKLTPSVRAKRKSDVNSSPTSSGSMSTAGGSVTPKQSTVVADDQSTLKSLLMKPSLSLQRPTTSAKNSPVSQISIPTSDVAKSTPISPDEKLSTFVKNSPQIALPPPTDGNGSEIKTELEKIKNSTDAAAGFEFMAPSETDGKEMIVAPIDVKPVRKHKFAHRNRSKKSELSAKSISSKDWSRTRGKRWYETASVFKQEWKIGRENWLEFDGTYMYCRICRERYYPGQSGHNSGFVDGISNGFVVNRISSHELSTAHRSALNSPSKSRPIDEPVVGIPKIKRNKGKWNKSWKKSKTKKPSTTLSIQEEIEIVKNNDPDEEKVLAQFVADTKQKQMTTETASKAKLSPTAPIRSPAVQSRVAHPCKYPMCGVSFDNAKDLCDHVQSDHRGKSSKSVVPKSKFNSKRRRRRRDVSLNASDSDSQSASEMSDSTPVGDVDPDYDVQSDVDDEMKTMSTDSNLSHLAEDDLVRCICGDTEENGMMVQCEQCSMWQHGACFYLEDSDSIPVKYICYMCKNPLGVRDTVRRRFETNKLWNESGELQKYGFISDHRKEQNLDDDLKTATNCRAMSKIYQNVVNLRENLKSVRFRILVANTPDHSMLKKIIPYDSPSNENEARERLREDISRLQDEIETNLDAIEQFVTTYEVGQRNEHDFEDLNAANLFTSELIKNLAKVRKITILLEK